MLVVLSRPLLAACSLEASLAAAAVQLESETRRSVGQREINATWRGDSECRRSIATPRIPSPTSAAER